MTYNTPQDSTDPLQGAIWQALGEASAVFMSNPLPGTEQVMPEDQLSRIGSRLYNDIKGEQKPSDFKRYYLTMTSDGMITAHLSNEPMEVCIERTTKTLRSWGNFWTSLELKNFQAELSSAPKDSIIGTIQDFIDRRKQ